MRKLLLLLFLIPNLVMGIGIGHKEYIQLNCIGTMKYNGYEERFEKETFTFADTFEDFILKLDLKYSVRGNIVPFFLNSRINEFAEYHPSLPHWYDSECIETIRKFECDFVYNFKEINGEAQKRFSVDPNTKRGSIKPTGEVNKITQYVSRNGKLTIDRATGAADFFYVEEINRIFPENESRRKKETSQGEFNCESRPKNKF